MVKPFIQDISDIQNINPTTSFENIMSGFGMRSYHIKSIIVKNYSLDELMTIRDSLESSESIKAAIIEYDYLSGDALRIGEAINILKLQYKSLYKIEVVLPDLRFEVNFEKGASSVIHYFPYRSDLYITSEFTPRALEPIVGSILKNVYLESLSIHFKTKNVESEITPAASYIFDTFEEYFSTPERIDLVQQYDCPNFYYFYLGAEVLKNMGNELWKHADGYQMIYGPSINKELDNFTAQELLEATLITKDINKSDSILKILPDEIIKKILLEHVGASELGLIANRGKMNLYYDKKVKDKFKTIGEKKININAKQRIN